MRSISWAIEAMAYIFGAGAVGLAVYFASSGTEAASNYAAISGLWCGFFVAYVLAISIRSGLKMVPLIMVIDAIAVSNGIGYHDPLDQLAVLVLILFARAVIMDSPIVGAVIVKSLLVRARIVGPSGTRHS